jgi:hypothetical protein
MVIPFLGVSNLLQAQGKTVMADVTGDGVDDEIKIGEQSVVVVDGASNKKWIVVSGMEIVNAKIDDYHPYMPGKEIAIFTNFAEPVFAIYGFKNKQFKQISDNFSGDSISLEIVQSSDSFISVFMAHLIFSTYPIIVINDSLTQSTPLEEIEKTIEIDAQTAKEITINLSENTLLLCEVSVKEKNVIVSIEDETNNLICGGEKIYPESPLKCLYHAPSPETITLTIDNSYSLMTPKTVTYKIKKFKYP